MIKTNEIDAALNELATAHAAETTEETTVAAPFVEPDTTATEIVEEVATEQVAPETIDIPAAEIAPVTGQTADTVDSDVVAPEEKRPYVVEKNFPWLNISRLFDEPEDEDAPADEIVSTTPTTETTGEPVTTQAPATQIDNAPTDAPGCLPKDYLINGYYATTDKGAKYLRPEFVGKYAETMATLLSDMKSSAFTGLLREMKRSKKATLPFEARMTAAAEMLPKALALVHRKKAPALLVSFIKDNLDHIQNDDDWTAYYRHLEAIAAYHAAQRGGD